MLSIAVRDYVFIYSHGRAIGAVIVPGQGTVRLVFSGEEKEFQVLRAPVVERLFGKDELDRLVRQFVNPN